jgi:hypothetical protein
MVKTNRLYKLEGDGGCGFFCMLANICHLIYKEDHNVFINWSRNKYDKKGMNVFDFIFTQNYPEDYTVIGPMRPEMWKPELAKFFKSYPTNENTENIEEFNRRFWSIFSINDKLQQRLDSLNQIKKNKKTLSVHIRRSDSLSVHYFKPYMNYDPNNMEFYYNKIKETYEQGDYEKLFVCTEDRFVMDYLKSKFDENILFYQDVTRVFFEKIDQNSTLQSIYNQNGEELLLEIMSDVLFASKCDGFLGTPYSGVSIFIEIFNNNKFESKNYF